MENRRINRRRIRSLEKQVADRIAAGEVVDRPLSIVKELVENSIDAGADSITLEIKNGGKTFIRVTDNGCGIPSEDIEIAFLRHSTSKIVTDNDLSSIETLGFRGEALASIAAVTRTQMITKTPEEATGTRISIEGSAVTEKVPVGAAEGTTIIVRDLFYNTPARMKFLKKDHTESGLIIDFMCRMTLAYPGIRFRLINNGKMMFHTTGKGDVLENIYAVYGKETAENLIPFEGEEDGIRAEGYISQPTYTKSSRRNQFYFVNGRNVSDKTMEDAVSAGYGDKIFENRYPVAYVFLTVPANTVDVNVHPNKKEVRFDEPEKVRELIRRSIFERLNTREGVGRFDRESILRETPGAEPDLQVREDVAPFKRVSFADPLPEGTQEKLGVEVISLKTDKKDEKPYSGGRTQSAVSIARSSHPEGYFSPAAPKDPELRDPREEEARAMRFDLGSLTVLGVVFLTYITAYDEEYFYLIDQHAAHERVFYEQFLDAFYQQEAAPQLLMTPLIRQTDLKIAASGDTGWMEFLRKSGFIIEEFGGKSVRISGIPAYMDLSEAQRFLDDYIDSVSDSTNFKDQKTLDKIILRSCKAAVKANDRLGMEEIRALLEDLSKCSNPFSCPHGRPAIIRLSKREMEKMFKRIV